MDSRSVYWFVTQDWDGDLPEISADAIKQEVQDLVRGWEGGIGNCVNATDAASISRSRLGDRWVPPQLGSAPNFTLAGDALHPMTPNLGQVRNRHGIWAWHLFFQVGIAAGRQAAVMQCSCEESIAAE